MAAEPAAASRRRAPASSRCLASGVSFALNHRGGLCPSPVSRNPLCGTTLRLKFCSCRRRKLLHMRNSHVVFLRISALILSAYAVAFLVNPHLLGRLVGFSHHSPNTLVEVTAFYGGLELGLAIFLVWSSNDSSRVRTGLKMLFFVFLAAGVARAVGIVRFGFEDPSQPIVTALEICWAFVANWMAERRVERVAPSDR